MVRRRGGYYLLLGAISVLLALTPLVGDLDALFEQTATGLPRWVGVLGFGVLGVLGIAAGVTSLLRRGRTISRRLDASIT